jgi:hypothetical protein
MSTLKTHTILLPQAASFPPKPCKHNDKTWIDGFSRFNGKQRKGKLGENILFDVIDVVRGHLSLPHPPFFLGQPHLRDDHSYPDILLQTPDNDFLFENRNLYWHRDYRQQGELFADELLGKKWSERVLPLRNPNAGAFALLMSEPIKVYVSTVPNFSKSSRLRIESFFDYPIFTNHCFLPEAALDEEDARCFARVVAELTLVVEQLLRENS